MISDLTEDEGTWLDEHTADALAASQSSVEDRVVAADLAERLLETMSPDDRLVLSLVDGEETPVKEVSEMTGWSESKVKVRAFRARRRMREALEKLLARGGRKPSATKTAS